MRRKESMNLEAERKLKFDRRMEGRPNWTDEEEFGAELAALPDSANKIAEEDETEEPESSLDAGPDAPVKI